MTPRSVELGQARLHGAARDVEPARGLHQADARLGGHAGRSGVRRGRRSDWSYCTEPTAGRLGDVGRPDRSERADLPVLARRGALVAERTTRGGGDVRRGPALLAGHAARRRQGRGPPRPGPSRGSTTRPTATRRNEIAAAAMAWTPGEPIPHVDYTEAEHEIWRDRLPRAARQAREVRLPRVPRGQGRASALPEDRVPQLDEVTAGLRPLTGFEYHCAPGLVPLREFYGALGRPRLPLHAVRPPPVRAALHARAGHHPRGHRPREHARQPALRRDQAPGRRGRPPRRDRRGAAVHRRRLLVHARVRRHPRGRRAQGLRRRHPLELRRDRGVPPHGDPPARPRRDGRRSSTTSPSTSRSSTRPSRWTTSRTSSAASSPRPTTTRRRGCTGGLATA